MQPIPLVRVWCLVPFVTFLEGIGSPVDRWLEDSKIAPELIESPADCVPLEYVLQFTDRAAREEGADTLGIDVARRLAAEDFGAWDVLADCPNLLDRIRKVCAMLPLENTGLRMWYEVRGDKATICSRFVDGLGPGARHAEDLVLMLTLEAMDRAAEPGWKPDMIRFPSIRSDRFRRDELFQDVRLEYGSSHVEVTIPRAMLSQPMREWKPSCARAGASGSVVEQSAPAPDFVGSLEATITTILHLGPPSIADIAELTNTSVRTLQRRLGEEGVSLSTVLDRARFRLADEFLRDEGATVTDVAFQLGYSNPPAFTRAFRRWTGVSPQTYQTQLRLN